MGQQAAQPRFLCFMEKSGLGNEKRSAGAALWRRGRKFFREAQNGEGERNGGTQKKYAKTGD